MDVGYLFLDVDGVLNNHAFYKGAESTTLDRNSIERLNRVILETDCKIVISSSWRYMMLTDKPAMTLAGFEYMLRTHWLAVPHRIVGLTCSDEITWRRDEQILLWLKEHPEVKNWAVLDDDPMNMQFGTNQWRLVRTDGDHGLSETDVNRLIEILKKGK